MKVKYTNRIRKLQMENDEKENIIEWYKNELEAAVNINKS